MVEAALRFARPVHVLLEGTPPGEIVPVVAQRLRQRFGIEHSTILLDSENCADQHHLC